MTYLDSLTAVQFHVHNTGTADTVYDVDCDIEPVPIRGDHL